MRATEAQAIERARVRTVLGLMPTSRAVVVGRTLHPGRAAGQRSTITALSPQSDLNHVVLPGRIER